MSTERNKRNVLMYLAAEGVVPVLGGCAGALVAGPQGGLVGLVVGQAVEKAINLFGRGIVEKWQGWFAAATPEERAAAIAELAALPPADARSAAEEALSELAPDALAADLAIALDYLSVLPQSVDRALVHEPGGAKSLPATITFGDAQSLLPLLPQDVPPYPSSTDLPGTPYRLEALLGSGGFGAVYRAVSPTLQHLPLAIKFCLDRSLIQALNLERSNLERLMRAGRDPGAAHVVRLYGYDLDHPTPYLVYEYVAGGDLTHYLSAKRTSLDRELTAVEVLGLIAQIAQGLAFAHAAGLVHRDVKPANVLADGDVLKLADFGLGGVAVRRAVQRSRIGTTTIDYLSLAEQASLFRGAGTPLYMSPEQRRGANPDPRHDLYSLGVLWFQLLAGDVSRELHPGWAKELAVRYGIPPSHIELIDRCVGWFDERPKDASELVPLLRQVQGDDSQPVLGRTPPALPVARFDTVRPEVTPASAPRSAIRKERLLDLLRELMDALAMSTVPDPRLFKFFAGGVFLLVWIIVLAVLAAQTPRASSYGVSKISDGEMLWIPLAFAGPFTLVLSGAFYVASRLMLGFRKQSAVGRILHSTIQEFPAEVEAWGGLEQLASAAVVRATIDQVARPTFHVSESRPPAPKRRSEPKAEPTSGPIPVSAIRKEALLSRLRTLRGQLTPPARVNTWDHIGFIAMVAVLTIVAVSLTAGALTRDLPEGLQATFVLIPTVALGVLIPWRLSHWLIANDQRRYEARTARRIARIREAFPGDVASWGDAAMLSDRAFVEAALKRVESPDYEVQAAPDPTSPSPRPEPERRAAPWWVAVGLSFVLALTFAIGLGIAVDVLAGPTIVSVDRSSTAVEYFDGRSMISHSDYLARSWNAQALAVVASAAAFVAGLAGGTWALTRPRRLLGPTLVALSIGYFVLGLPSLIATPLLVNRSIAPIQLATVTKSIPEKGDGSSVRFGNRAGSPMTVAEYAYQQWRAGTIGHSLALVVGIGLMTGAVGFARWRARVAAESVPG